MIMPMKNCSRQSDVPAKPSLRLQPPTPGYFRAGFASAQPPSAMQVQPSHPSPDSLLRSPSN